MTTRVVVIVVVADRGEMPRGAFDFELVSSMRDSVLVNNKSSRVDA